MAITTKRIINLDTAASTASDDYIVLDGTTNGTRKLLTDGKGLSTNDYTDNEKAQVATNASDISDLQTIINALTIYDTASGSIATFTDGANYPLKSCTAEINAVQSGSGDPSPNNVRPISGWNSVQTTVKGRNLFDDSEIVEGSIYTTNGQNATASGSKRTNNYISVKGGATYTISGLGGTVRLYQYKKDKTYISNDLQSNGNFTPDDECYYIRIAGSDVWATGTVLMRVSTDADSTFEAYDTNSTTYTTALNNTYYGGTLDVVSGVLTVTHGYVDLGDLTWTHDGSSIFRLTTDIGAYNETNTSTVVALVCSAYKTVAQTSAGTDKSVSSLNWGYGIRVCDTSYGTDPAAFKAGVSGVKLAYVLKTPTTVQLTGQEVTALLGTNNIWADSGDIAVEYLVNIGLRL